MGYDKLDAALAWQRNLPPAGSNIVIADTLKSNGNFLLHHFIVNHLRANQPVIVIGLSQIFNHYFLIGRKLGINLQTLKQNQQFAFIDGLTHLTSYTQKAPFPSVTTPTTPNAVLNGTSVQEFYNVIREQVEASAEKSPNPLVIIDDANVLLWAGFSHNDVIALLHNIRVLIESVQGTLVTVVHADEEGNDDDENDSFVRTMLSRADIVLMVEPLQSGQSRDVHGQLSIINGPKQRGLVEAQALHYRTIDSVSAAFPESAYSWFYLVMTTQETLRTLLENLEAFKPTIIPSPKHQPRRACVSIIIRWNGHEHNYKDKEPMATTWRQFLDKPWVKNNKNGGPELLFMQRATRTGDRWSGHVAFPGGKNEKDETDVETVVRETWEEVGLDLNAEDFIPVGRLDDREITSAQDGKLIMMLSPFVYLQVSPQTPTLKLQTTEVASVHWIPLQFFLSVEPYSYRPMKIKLMNKMPPHLRSLAPVAQGLFGNMEVPAIDLPDGNPSSPPRLWGLTLGMTSQLINMTVGFHSGRPIRSRNEKRLAFVDLESSPPKYSFPDIAALVWMFFKIGLAWQNIRGVRKRSKSSRTTSWAEDADLPLYYAALRKSLAVAGILRVAGVMIIILKAYKLLKYRRGVMA